MKDGSVGKSTNLKFLLTILLLLISIQHTHTSDDYNDETIENSEFYASSSSLLAENAPQPPPQASPSYPSSASAKQTSNLEQYLSRKLNLNDINPASHASIASSASYLSESTLAKKPPKLTNINNLVYHQDSLYVAAQNWLLKLNAHTLEVEQSVQYGPVHDSVSCRFSSHSKEECLNTPKKQMLPNYNKILLVHSKEQLLLSCWSARQGICDLRDLYNITRLVQESMQPAVGNDAVNSTVGFIATSSNSQDLFYVANTYTSLGQYRDEVPALAGRSMSTQPNKFMEVIQSKSQGLKSSQVRISIKQN